MRAQIHKQPETMRAFTLVELVMVIVIIGVLGALAVPRFGQAAERQRLQAAADRVVADFALAQDRARAASQSVTIYFDPDQATYKFNDVGGEASTVYLGQAPYGVKISDALFGQDSEVEFNAFGVPVDTGSVTLSSNTGSVTITLLESGEVTR